MTDSGDRVRALEEGQIYFFYRPKIGEDKPSELEEVQRMYFVLSPEGRDLYRLAVMGRKRLPGPGRAGRQRFWGFIRRVARDPGPIRDELREEGYGTETRGLRKVPVSRPMGEGVYRILRHGDHTHLVYALELPRESGEVQEEFGVEEEASYILSIKNPQKDTPREAGVSEERQADYPKNLVEKFRGRRFAEADPPALLDYEGAEFVLIAASGDVSRELGVRLEPEQEQASTADIFHELRLRRTEHPVRPLLTGDWE